MEGGGKSLSLPRWRVVCAENVEPNREAEREAIYDVRVFYNARNIMHTNVLRTNIVFEWRITTNPVDQEPSPTSASQTFLSSPGY